MKTTSKKTKAVRLDARDLAFFFQEGYLIDLHNTRWREVSRTAGTIRERGVAAVFHHSAGPAEAEFEIPVERTFVLGTPHPRAVPAPTPPRA